MRYRIRLSYDGSTFCGWQKQNNAATVQEELENALSTLTQAHVQVTGAGRTDTGVNAINYIAHTDLPEETGLSAEALHYKLNAILPRTIAVHEILPIRKNFTPDSTQHRANITISYISPKTPSATGFHTGCGRGLMSER